VKHQSTAQSTGDTALPKLTAANSGSMVAPVVPKEPSTMGDALEPDTARFLSGVPNYRSTHTGAETE
jgi:hypothetical protein